MGITRRIFMITGGVLGGGLVLGVGGLAAHLATHDRRAVQASSLFGPEGAQINLWLRIAGDNTVYLMTPHTDMGQGSNTGLMQIVAEELDLDWGQLQLVQAPSTTDFSNGKVFEGFIGQALGKPPAWAAGMFENAFYRLTDVMKMQMTGGSTAVRFTGWEAMRKAAAATRMMLIEAAAERLGTGADSLRTEAGFVVAASGERLSYGELAAAAAEREVPETISFKDPAQWRIIGQPVPREDLDPKVFPNTLYGIDVDVPGMQYAAVAPSGVTGAAVKSIDNRDEILGRRGVSAVLPVRQAVAVVADNPWRAEQAVKAVKVSRDPHDNDALSTDSQKAVQNAALDGELKEGLSEGEPDGDAPVTANYFAPYLAHATMEPMGAALWRADGKLHVACGVQNPLNAHARVADLAGLKHDEVVLHAKPMGGGFGRRVAFGLTDDPLDWLEQAVQIHLHTNQPVKMTWSREMDTRTDVYRPMVLARYAGAVEGNKAVRWRQASYGVEQNLEEVAPPYAIPNRQVSFADGGSPIPVGFWRSVAASQFGFFNESFIDELATAAGADPLHFRLDNLPGDSSHAAVLRKVAEMAGWRTGVDDTGRAMGVAVVHSFGSTVAEIAEVSIEGGAPRVHRVWCAVDCGIAVNPQAVEAQVQGGVHYALSAALYGRIDLQNGAVVQSNFHDYRMVTMAQAPRVEVATVSMGSPMGGIGEVGVPPLAPAVANALFQIDGQRRRDMPLV